jgi:sulfate permease, SulP family
MKPFKSLVSIMRVGSERIKNRSVRCQSAIASIKMANMLKRSSLEKAMPGLVLLLRYDRSQLAADALAALVVAVVLIPSAIAYADLAKCAPAAGLYASVASMVVYGLFASSRHVIVGPDAAIALLVGSVIGPLAMDDPGKAVTLSTVLALLTGCVLLLMARLRLGIAADFLSSPALLGFMNGAALVIIGSQIGKLCGITLTKDNTLLRFFEWISRLGSIHVPTALAGALCIIILALCRWKLRSVPGAVVVFVLAMIAGRFIDFSQHGMQVIGAVDLNLPDPVRPGLNFTEAAPLFTAAIGIALLAFSEGVVLGRSVAGKHGYAIDPDRELLALGAANIAAGLVCSFSISSSQTRTLLNDGTGGRTQMVSFLAAALVTGIVLLLATWLATVPSVAIAAILVITGLSLIDAGLYQRLWRQHGFSTLVAAATTVGVVALGVLPGILLGVILSLLGVLAEIVRPQDALLGIVEGSSNLHDVGDDETAKTIPGLVVYRFYGPLIFANVRFFIERIEWFIAQEKQPVRQVIVDARAIPSIDITATEQLGQYVARLHEREIEFIVAKAHLPLRETVASIGGVLGESLRFSHVADAIAAFKTSNHLMSSQLIR